MRADTTGIKEICLPFHFALPEKSNEFSKEASVRFENGHSKEIRFKDYLFSEQTLQERVTIKALAQEPNVEGHSIPIFSISAVVFLILFRNLFHSSFQKYFLSLNPNFEIDFNLQKIGVAPVVISLIIIYLSLLDFLKISGMADGSFIWLYSAQILFYPMLVSSAVLIFFSFSVRIFPMIFPDIKCLFFIALLLLTCNFFSFSQKLSLVDLFPTLPGFLAFLFFSIRGVLFLGVLQKFYRFRTTLSLFYICTLNLVSGLLIYKILN